MARKTTQEQAEARLTMYTEAIDHLGMLVCETKEQEAQALIVTQQIEQLKNRFERQFYSTKKP